MLANLLEFPSLEVEEGKEEGRKEELTEMLEKHGVNLVSDLQLLGDVAHVFSHINMTYVVYTGEVVKGEEDVKKKTKEESMKDSEVSWLTSEEFSSCGTSTAMRKVFKRVNEVKIGGGGKRKREEGKEDSKQKSIMSFFVKKEQKVK